MDTEAQTAILRDTVAEAVTLCRKLEDTIDQIIDMAPVAGVVACHAETVYDAVWEALEALRLVRCNVSSG